MSQFEREALRERVASGDATGEERDRLAAILVRALRERDDHELEQIEELIDELRELADSGSDRSGCTDALAGALLDAQIRAFERGDPADAWRRLDELRARLHRGGVPDLLQDRLAAALYNAHRGGELLDDEAMRLAALEELRTRAAVDASAAACRVALAEILADQVALGGRRGEVELVTRARAELEALRERDRGLAVARQLARALREQLQVEAREAPALLARLRELVREHEPGTSDPLLARFAEGLVVAHVHALRDDDEDGAEVLREELRELARKAQEEQEAGRGEGPTRRVRRRGAAIREYGRALHDAAVLGIAHSTRGQENLSPASERAARALAQLRALVARHEVDLELRAQLMSALFQVHRNAIECGELEAAERLQAEADALLARDEALALADRAESAEPRRAGILGPVQTSRVRAQELRRELRLDHLRMLLATHAQAGDRGDWQRAGLLLARARNLVDRAEGSLPMTEVLGQMLVNAHVDAGEAGSGPPGEDQLKRAQALLLELRELARTHPQSRSLQLHLATALFNAHVDAGRRHDGNRAEQLLDELEQLHQRHPGLLDLRRRLVMALVNHHGEALEREDYGRAHEVLGRLRELVRSEDADDHLRVQLAMALGNTLAHIDDAASTEEGERIVSELRMLAAREDASEALRTLVLDELSGLFAPKQ